MRMMMFSILVPDYDEGIAFFCDVLGFELIADQDQGRKRWVVVRPRQGGSDIVIARADGPDQIARIGSQTGGRIGFFLQTDDFEATHAAMMAKGVTFAEVPRHEEYGTVAVFHDPWGNGWDLLGSPAAEQV